MERYIAIDNVCAWPNLTKLKNGDIIAAVFNQPCHGMWEGDVECWSSTDGRFWEKRGVPALHEPGTNRMNVSAGTANNGDLIVIASGWDNRPPRPDPLPVFPHDAYRQPEGMSHEESRTLMPAVCRSADGGRSWERSEIRIIPRGADGIVPFGDIAAGAEGLLGTTCYKHPGRVWFRASHDDGRTWPEYHAISEGFNETAVLHLGNGNWLAAARPDERDGMVLFRSTDNGVSWVRESRISLPEQHPGHLLRLKDGRILFSCGMRNAGFRGVMVRASEDEGKTWSGPLYLVDFECDGGYPSSVQIEDGTIITAYYSMNTPNHQRYHMGIARWRALYSYKRGKLGLVFPRTL